MKILRAANLRGSSIHSAGFFTVLRSNSWFAASRLPVNRGLFGDRHKLSAKSTVPGRAALSHADSRAAAMPLHIMNLGTEDRGSMRLVFIVLAAAALTLVLLWFGGDCPRLW